LQLLVTAVTKLHVSPFWLLHLKDSRSEHSGQQVFQPYFRPVRLAYNPYFFSQRTVFFSHNKSANGTFSHGLSAKRTDSQKLETQNPTEA